MGLQIAAQAERYDFRSRADIDSRRKGDESHRPCPQTNKIRGCSAATFSHFEKPKNWKKRDCRAVLLLEDTMTSIRLIFVLALLIFGCSAADQTPAAATGLESPDQTVRDSAAKNIRQSYKAPEAGRWNDLLARLKPGLPEPAVLDLLGPARNRKKPGFAYMNGRIDSYRLDDLWCLQIEISRWEHTLASVKLIDMPLQFWTTPPDHFSGVWRDYYVSGVPSREVHYLDGLRHGADTTFHPNGKVASEQHFLKGLNEGVEAGYFSSGKLSSMGRYKDGKPTGTWTFYNEDGTVRHTEDKN